MVRDNIKSDTQFIQIITPYTSIKKVDDTFTIADIDSRVRFVVLTLYAYNGTGICSVTMPVNRFKTAPSVYFNLDDADYKLAVNLTTQKVTSVGSSTAAYGVYIEIIGY